MDSSTYCHDDCYSSNPYYEAILVTVDTAGSYHFKSKSDFDVCGSIYTDYFDPSSTSINLLAHDDDSGGDMQFDLTVILQSQSTYVLVVTTYSAYVMGSFQIIPFGPGSVRLTRATDSLTAMKTMTSTTIATTPVNS
jgi:hypothetical protein